MAQQRFEKLYKMYVLDHPEVGFLTIDIEEIQSAASKATANADITKSATSFARFISKLLQQRELERNGKHIVAIKVEKALTKLYPLLNLSLRLVQGASDVATSSA